MGPLTEVLGDFEEAIKNIRPDGEHVQGLVVLDTNLIIYGQKTWIIYDQKGNLQRKSTFEGEGEILELSMLDELEDYSLISWTGDSASPQVCLQSYRSSIPTNPLRGHCSVIINKKHNRAFICETPE